MSKPKTLTKNIPKNIRKVLLLLPIVILALLLVWNWRHQDGFFIELTNQKGSTTSDDTSSAVWQTYWSGDNNSTPFSVSYPTGWVFRESDNLVGFYPRSKDVPTSISDDTDYVMASNADYVIVKLEGTSTSESSVLDDYGFDAGKKSTREIVVKGQHAQDIVSLNMTQNNYLEAVEIDTPPRVFIIINTTGVKDPNFEKFYLSFTINQTGTQPMKTNIQSYAAIIKKILLKSGDTTYIAWANKAGGIEYFQVPADPGSDQFYYLFDTSGNEIVKAGGFATVKANEEKFASLTKGLSAVSSIQ